MKIEILGVFDPETKMIRMKLVNPQQSATSVGNLYFFVSMPRLQNEVK